MGRAPALHSEAVESAPINWAWQSTLVIPLFLRQKEDQEFKAIPRLYFKSQAWLRGEDTCANRGWGSLEALLVKEREKIFPN